MALEARATTTRWMPVFLSRLLPPAIAAKPDDAQTREGYLRNALMKATDGYLREGIAAEMVRSNLDAQWPALAPVFYSEQRRDGSDARIGVLKALGV